MIIIGDEYCVVGVDGGKNMDNNIFELLNFISDMFSSLNYPWKWNYFHTSFPIENVSKGIGTAAAVRRGGVGSLLSVAKRLVDGTGRYSRGKLIIEGAERSTTGEKRLLSQHCWLYWLQHQYVSHQAACI